MSYHPTADVAWLVFGSLDVYRFLDPTATYAPDGAWPTNGGRFDDGLRATLYVSLTAEAAVAEFFRRHPELLELQARVRLRTFRFELRCISEGCDVRTEGQANAVGIALERLTSSDARPNDRYRECRELADEVDRSDGVGIAFPSAAYVHGENVVVFHTGVTGGWSSHGVGRVPTPAIDASQVRTIA